MSLGINSAYGSVLQNFKVPTIPTVSVEEVRRQDALRNQETNAVAPAAYEAPLVSPVNKPDTSIEDLSITFNRREDFGYLGQDSDIHSLDVERAILDMQKDRMLQQYQYFVGSARNVESGMQADGIVVPKF